MKAYRSNIDRDNVGDRYCRLYVLTDKDRRALNEMFCSTPISLDTWVPFKVERSPSKPGNLTRPLGDRAGIDFKTDPMVLSRRALDVLLPHIAGAGQVLPLDFDECDYSLFNVTNVVDALDVKHSKIKYFDDGGLQEIEEFAFRPEALRDQFILKIPQRKRGFVYVTDQFVQIVQDAKLTGFSFDLVWSDEAAA